MSSRAMVRTIVQLPEDQAGALERAARRRGVSKAAVVREALSAMLARASDDPAVERALSAAGSGASGTTSANVTTTSSPNCRAGDLRRHVGAARLPRPRGGLARAGRREHRQRLPRSDGLTHNYVLVETEALAHRRLGAGVARRLLEDVVPALEVVWVDADLHAAAGTAYLRALRRRSSLVDRVSFELMRRRGIRSALALDGDFARAGFDLLPPT